MTKSEYLACNSQMRYTILVLKLFHCKLSIVGFHVIFQKMKAWLASQIYLNTVGTDYSCNLLQPYLLSFLSSLISPYTSCIFNTQARKLLAKFILIIIDAFLLIFFYFLKILVSASELLCLQGWCPTFHKNETVMEVAFISCIPSFKLLHILYTVMYSVLINWWRYRAVSTQVSCLTS